MLKQVFPYTVVDLYDAQESFLFCLETFSVRQCKSGASVLGTHSNPDRELVAEFCNRLNDDVEHHKDDKSCIIPILFWHQTFSEAELSVTSGYEALRAHCISCILSCKYQEETSQIHGSHPVLRCLGSVAVPSGVSESNNSAQLFLFDTLEEMQGKGGGSCFSPLATICSLLSSCMLFVGRCEKEVFFQLEQFQSTLCASRYTRTFTQALVVIFDGHDDDSDHEMRDNYYRKITETCQIIFDADRFFVHRYVQSLESFKEIFGLYLRMMPQGRCSNVEHLVSKIHPHGPPQLLRPKCLLEHGFPLSVNLWFQLLYRWVSSFCYDLRQYQQPELIALVCQQSDFVSSQTGEQIAKLVSGAKSVGNDHGSVERLLYLFSLSVRDLRNERIHRMLCEINSSNTTSTAKVEGTSYMVQKILHCVRPLYSGSSDSFRLPKNIAVMQILPTAAQYQHYFEFLVQFVAAKVLNDRKEFERNFSELTLAKATEKYGNRFHQLKMHYKNRLENITERYRLEQNEREQAEKEAFGDAEQILRDELLRPLQGDLLDLLSSQDIEPLSISSWIQRVIQIVQDYVDRAEQKMNVNAGYCRATDRSIVVLLLKWIGPNMMLLTSSLERRVLTLLRGEENRKKIEAKQRKESTQAKQIILGVKEVLKDEEERKKMESKKKKEILFASFNAAEPQSPPQVKDIRKKGNAPQKYFFPSLKVRSLVQTYLQQVKHSYQSNMSSQRHPCRTEPAHAVTLHSTRAVKAVIQYFLQQQAEWMGAVLGAEGGLKARLLSKKRQWDRTLVAARFGHEVSTASVLSNSSVDFRGSDYDSASSFVKDILHDVGTMIDAIEERLTTHKTNKKTSAPYDYFYELLSSQLEDLEFLRKKMTQASKNENEQMHLAESADVDMAPTLDKIMPEPDFDELVQQLEDCILASLREHEKVDTPLLETAKQDNVKAAQQMIALQHHIHRSAVMTPLRPIDYEPLPEMSSIPLCSDETNNPEETSDTESTQLKTISTHTDVAPTCLPAQLITPLIIGTALRDDDAVSHTRSVSLSPSPSCSQSEASCHSEPELTFMSGSSEELPGKDSCDPVSSTACLQLQTRALSAENTGLLKVIENLKQNVTCAALEQQGLNNKLNNALSVLDAIRQEKEQLELQLSCAKVEQERQIEVMQHQATEIQSLQDLLRVGDDNIINLQKKILVSDEHYTASLQLAAAQNEVEFENRTYRFEMFAEALASRQKILFEEGRHFSNFLSQVSKSIVLSTQEAKQFCEEKYLAERQSLIEQISMNADRNDIHEQRVSQLFSFFSSILLEMKKKINQSVSGCLSGVLTSFGKEALSSLLTDHQNFRDQLQQLEIGAQKQNFDLQQQFFLQQKHANEMHTAQINELLNDLSAKENEFNNEKKSLLLQIDDQKKAAHSEREKMRKDFLQENESLLREAELQLWNFNEEKKRLRGDFENELNAQELELQRQRLNFSEEKMRLRDTFETELNEQETIMKSQQLEFAEEKQSIQNGFQQQLQERDSIMQKMRHEFEQELRDRDSISETRQMELMEQKNHLRTELMSQLDEKSLLIQKLRLEFAEEKNNITREFEEIIRSGESERYQLREDARNASLEADEKLEEALVQHRKQVDMLLEEVQLVKISSRKQHELIVEELQKNVEMLHKQLMHQAEQSANAMQDSANNLVQAQQHFDEQLAKQREADEKEHLAVVHQLEMKFEKMIQNITSEAEEQSKVYTFQLQRLKAEVVRNEAQLMDNQQKYWNTTTLLLKKWHEDSARGLFAVYKEENQRDLLALQLTNTEVRMKNLENLLEEQKADHLKSLEATIRQQEEQAKHELAVSAQELRDQIRQQEEQNRLNIDEICKRHADQLSFEAERFGNLTMEHQRLSLELLAAQNEVAKLNLQADDALRRADAVDASFQSVLENQRVGSMLQARDQHQSAVVTQRQQLDDAIAAAQIEYSVAANSYARLASRALNRSQNPSSRSGSGDSVRTRAPNESIHNSGWRTASRESRQVGSLAIKRSPLRPREMVPFVKQILSSIPRQHLETE